MADSPRHRSAREKDSRIPRRLLRAGLTLSAAGAAVVGGAVGASAAPAGPLPQASTGGLTALSPDASPVAGVQSGLAPAVAPVLNHQLHPMANTGVDPLSNTVGTQLGDFRPVGSQNVTGPISGGASLGDLLGGSRQLPPG